MQKPTTLYRGIVLAYQDFLDFQLIGKDMVMHYSPLYDNEERKTVRDGNEYGIYMSDNRQMVLDVYSNSRSTGNLLTNTKIGLDPITIPAIGIAYQIDTRNVVIRKPRLYKFESLNNNGYIGDEWIADRIPSDSYQIIRVRIGSDYLHPSEDIDVTNPNEIQNRVIEIVEKRIIGLKDMLEELKDISPQKIRQFGLTEREILQSIYGTNGVKYIDEDTMRINSVDDLMNFIIAKEYKSYGLMPTIDTLKSIMLIKDLSKDIPSFIENIQKKKEEYLQSGISNSVVNQKIETLSHITDIIMSTLSKQESSPTQTKPKIKTIA